jgi:LSD1 subclass zinc finger protein
MSFEEKTASIDESLKCSGCGAMLQYEPGTQSLLCPYCGTRNEIQADVDQEIAAVDYDTFIAGNGKGQQTSEALVVKCSNCGASTTMLPGVTADSCPFCASPLVVSMQETKQILKPHYVLPFVVKREAAYSNFKAWLKGLWFAPNDLVRKVQEASSQQLKGVYIPYWSYDTDTQTQYSGRRGEYYYTTESYKDSNGNTQTRQVRHTAWYPASGTVFLNFRDVLVSASKSLPQRMANELEPWDIGQLTAFKESYLSGFRAETYQIDAPAGLETAKQKIDPDIRDAIRSDIGGDEQEISDYEVRYHNLALKYILLPVWISAYPYNGKVYNFMVNACTGEVVGDRPYSWIKITLAILVALAIVLLVVYLVNNN